MVATFRRLRQHTFCKGTRRLATLRAIEKGQGLGSDSRGGSLADSYQMLRPVKEHHHRNELAPLDKEINTSAAHVGVESSWTVHSGIQQTGNGEHAIADRFRF